MDKIKNKLLEIEALPPTIKNYLPTFLANRLQDVFNLKSAINGQDTKGISFICHSIYGVAPSYAMQELSIMAKQLSQFVKDQDYAQALNSAIEMENYIKSVQSHL